MDNSQLVQYLENLGYFSSSYETRVLAHLIHQPGPLTAKRISTSLNIPDSKVYPAINKLVEKRLVMVTSSSRPATYVFSAPEQLASFLRAEHQVIVDEQQRIIDQVIQESYLKWDPDEKDLGKVAHLFHGHEIIVEIDRMFKQAKDSLFLLLSINRPKMLETVKKKLYTLNLRGIRVQLAGPNIEDFTENSPEQIGGLILKRGRWSGNSYLVRDETTMLNITHRAAGDVALLTDDPLLVNGIIQCWQNPNCCQQDDFIELEIRDR